MEREYFKDRPDTVQYNKNLYKGEYVFICLKKMQPFAKEISDLTLTKITANLTSAHYHPRGQKIKGIMVNMDKYGNKLLVDEEEEVVGRCTYIVDDNCWSFDTNDGKKFLIYSNKKEKIEMYSYELLKGYMKIFCVLSCGPISFKFPLCRFVYFNDINKASDFVDKLNIKNIQYTGNMIIMNLNGQMIYEDKYQIFYKGKEIYNESEIFDIINNYSLELENFLLQKIL